MNAQSKFLYAFFWCGILIVFGGIAWLMFKHRGSMSVADVKSALAGKKKKADPAFEAEWTKDAQRVRWIGGAFWIVLIVLAVGFGAYNTWFRK